ncbi:MAG: hypothetical protein US68_C0009G0001, partial [Candidatus Shapirobacteria bacterium GW2011_GWE1_38_10]
DLIIFLSNKLKVTFGDFSRYDMFEYLESKGLHLTPVHFYQPIPDLSSLNWEKISKPQKIFGINFNDKKQLVLLNKFKKYQKEYNLFPTTKPKKNYEFFLNNLAFDNVDAMNYYNIVRHFKPKTIIEIGSGQSTKIAAKACLLNKDTKLISIEPYPQPILRKGFPGLYKLIPKKVENVDINTFKKLNKNDILFIDSSHVLNTGSDVVYEYLQILPQLKKGVIIHIHDIFFPFDYPTAWIKDEKRFWTEQYLVQALLTFSKAFQILLSNNYISHKYSNELRNIYPKLPHIGGGSLWLKKII